ncbi:MAG: hypothetical protein NTW59_01755, partial [Candidatus Diapherotrites archaeon]|nr:hypothetical protein [Candidatus Diapherotrites archaeon]
TVASDAEYIQSSQPVTGGSSAGIYNFAVVNYKYAVWVRKSGSYAAYYMRQISPSLGSITAITPTSSYTMVYPLLIVQVNGKNYPGSTQPSCIGSGDYCFGYTANAIAFASIVGERFVYASATTSGFYSVVNLTSPSTGTAITPTSGFTRIMPLAHIASGNAYFYNSGTQPSCIGSGAGCSPNTKTVAFASIVGDRFVYASADTSFGWYSVANLASPALGVAITPTSGYTTVKPPVRVVFGGETKFDNPASGCIGVSPCSNNKLDFVTVSDDSFVYAILTFTG